MSDSVVPIIYIGGLISNMPVSLSLTRLVSAADRSKDILMDKHIGITGKR